MKKLKKKKLLPSKKLNGILIKQSLESEKIKLFTDNHSFYDYFNKNPALMESHRVTFVADEISIAPNGRLITSDGRDFVFYKPAFYQLLNHLQIPLKFATRIPDELFIKLINGLLSLKLTDMFTFRLDSNNGIVAFFVEKQSRHENYNIMSRIIERGSKFPDKMSFAFAATQHFGWMLYLRFDDGSTDDVGIGLELLSSDNFTCYPMITGTIFSPQGHAVMKKTSEPIYAKNSVGDIGRINTVSAKVQSITGSLKGTMQEAAKIFGKMSEIKIQPNLKREIQNKATNMLRTSLSRKNAGLSLKKGMSLKEVYDNLRPLRKAINISLMEKRQISLFAGYLIELAERELKNGQ